MSKLVCVFTGMVLAAFLFAVTRVVTMPTAALTEPSAQKCLVWEVVK